jgi:hypothetical protein
VDEKQIERRGGDDRFDQDFAGTKPVELLAAVEQLAETLPWIYGSAMLAIVVSSACMMVARITQTVIAPRWTLSAARSAAIMTFLVQD